jgi:hypothetical protein
MGRARTVRLLFWACVAITALAPFILFALLQQRDAGTNLTNATKPVADLSANTVAEGSGERVWLINPVWDGKKHYPGMRPNTGITLHEHAARIVNATQQAREWFSAHLVYNRIVSMSIGKEYMVPLRMSTNAEPVNSFPQIFIGGVTPATSFAVEVMSAELTGSAGLSVKSEGIVKRMINGPEPAEWEWTVEPLSGGVQMLKLTVQAHFANAPSAVKIYRDQITVEVSGGQPATDFVALFDPVWKWLVATIGTLWAFYLWVAKRKWRLEPKNGKGA